MDFVEVIKQARALLQSEGRITYRTLKLQFQLDDEHFDALKEELLFSNPEIAEVDGRGLVWTEGATPEETASEAVDAPAPSAQPEGETPAHRRARPSAPMCGWWSTPPNVQGASPLFW